MSHLKHLKTKYSLEKASDEEHQKALDNTGFWGAQGAGCIVLAKSTGRILLAHRSSMVQEPNTWGVWGGAIDASEKPLKAIKRELKEETGYSGTMAAHPLFVFKKDKFKYSNFIAVVEDEFTPKLNWENQGFKWVEYSKWPTPLHFGLKALLADEKSIRVIQALINGEVAVGKPSLEEFIQGPLCNSYIKYKNIESYYRKGPLFINGKRVNALMRANSKNLRRQNNMEVNPKAKSTGFYRELDILTYELAKKYGFDGVYVENVLNDFLGDKLIEYGYTRLPDTSGMEVFSYWKPVK